MQLLITCPFGLSSLLSKEIKKLQLPIVQTLDTAVILDTDRKGLYQLNLRSRLANKVYLIMGESEVQTFDQLFDFITSLPRTTYLPATSDLSVQVTTKTSQLSAARTIQSVAHKAILTSIDPRVGTNNLSETQESSTTDIFLHLENNHLKVCLNTSGPSLHQRWWRKQTGAAPLKENLAAAMVLLSGRKFKAPLIDPFCGSGTLLIEAAMIAKNIAPGLQRKFAFQSFLNFDENLRNDLKNEAQTKIFPHTYQLIGRDIDPTVLTYAKENAERAGVTDTITRQQQSFTPCQGGHPTNSEYLLEGGGAVDPIRLLTNPPYGKRLSADEDLSPLYQQIATTLQQANHYGGVISSYPQLSTLFSPQSFSHKSLYNGADNVEFYWKKPL